MPDALYHRDRAKRERELAAKADNLPARLSHQKLAEEHDALAAALAKKAPPPLETAA